MRDEGRNVRERETESEGETGRYVSQRDKRASEKATVLRKTDNILSQFAVLPPSRE